MDKFILKSLWLFTTTCLLNSFTSAQDVRSFPISSRRRLPTVIITREHLRQRQNSYGSYGDTAAEFVVSAGLDTSKNSAVRIRRIGDKRINATHGTRLNLHRNFPNVTGLRNSGGIRPDQLHRFPSLYNIEERNGIPNTRTSINRRYNTNIEQNFPAINRRHQLDDTEQHINPPNRGFQPNRNRNPEGSFYQYRTPIFVPHYQQNRRTDLNGGVPGEGMRRPPNTVVDENHRRRGPNEQAYPIVSVKYSTSSVSAVASPKHQSQRPLSSTSNVDHVSTNKKILLPIRNNNNEEINRETIRRYNQQILHSPQNNSRNYYKEKQSIRLNNTNDLYMPNSPTIYPSKPLVEKPDTNVNKEYSGPTGLNERDALKLNKSRVINNMEGTEKAGKDEILMVPKNNSSEEVTSRNPVSEIANSEENGLTESPPFDIDKFRQIQTQLIRKPYLVLTDQITVNELPKKLHRPRFGPRSLEHFEENPSQSRQKRQIEYGEGVQTDVPFEKEMKNNFPVTNDSFFVQNESENKNSPQNTTQRNGKYDSQLFGKQFSRNLDISSRRTQKSDTVDQPNESRPSPVYEMFSDGTYDTDEDPSGSDIMSFSDFLASPMAEKIRLERQLFFKNTNTSKRNASIENSPANVRKFDARSLKNSTLNYIRNVIATRILDSILSLNNASNHSSISSKYGRSTERLKSAEQRHIGIMVTPYEEEQEIGDSHASSSKPVIRILKGRIVSLPDIPQELIPLILDTYKPSYTEPEEYHDDPNLSDNILDNAIYKLLQNEELLSLQQDRKPQRPITYKISNKKSPSTNYVGSLKSNQPMGKPKFSYSPSEWSLEPRCDRLTEEICLDDSDYPSSAIMSSIYKDKVKFDMMYAEVKVQESQVEGLSRQQETALAYDYQYGAYPQTSGSNLAPRDHGSNGGFVCPSEVHYARPHRAKNRNGEWKVVVNVGEYTQTLRMEKCLSSGNPCKYVVNQMQSTCAQVYSYHRILVFSKEKGLHIDVFRVPAACTCYLRSRKGYNIAASAPYLVRPNNNPYEEYGGHVETAPAPQVHAENHKVNMEKKRKSFSNTLWAILGGGQQASSLAQQPQFLDEVQKQISWTQQLKQFPHLMQQISPNQVLKQLLEDDDEDYSIRRQRIRLRHPFDQLTSPSFANHQVPLIMPLPPPPPPPPNVIQRRPVVSRVPVDQKNMFSASSDSQSKLITLSGSEPTKVFSLTKDRNTMNNPMRHNSDSGQRNIYTIVGHQNFKRIPNFQQQTYKVHPGMYPPQSENVQIPESSFLPIAPQFSSDPDNPLKPVMKPMPPPRGSNKSIIEDEDLMAAEKSVAGGVQSFDVESETDQQDTVSQDDFDSKINFSYHPILEYLNV